MPFEPTPSQKEAIESRGSTLLVAAGAGSGKTRVLTERLMRYLCDAEHPVSITRFVVITFTQAAAAELRGRITDELSRAIAAESRSDRPNTSLVTHLRRQQVICGKAQIGTIHAFCSSLLRENAQALSLPSDFKILSDERAEAMKLTALEQVLDERYQDLSAYPGFEVLVNTVGTGRDDSRLSELTLQLYEKMQCHSDPRQWAESRVAILREDRADVGTPPWGREILSRCISSARYWAEELDRVIASAAEDEIIRQAYLPSLADTADGIRELLRALSSGWDAARACPAVPFPAFHGVKKDYAPPLKDYVKARRDACKKAMGKITGLLYADSATLTAELHLTAPAMEALLRLTLDFEKKYTAQKRSAARLDYSDLEHLTANLLLQPDGSPTALARVLSKRYEEIMVDEYQDVSRVQDDIFRALSREGKNLFFVGDVKQAIYRFRLADPEIFNEKYRSYPVHADAEPGSPGKILLRENFRSRREIIQAANSVFSRCMTPELGEIRYDADAALIFGAREYSGEVPLPEVHLFPLPAQEDGERAAEKSDFEAECVARMIEELIVSQFPIRTQTGSRPVGYGDIAILLRSANSVGGAYRKALRAHNIPVVSGQGGGLFETREASFVLSFLHVLDNPRSDISMIAVLSSPVFRFSADDLARIRAAATDGCFYEAVRSASEENEKARQFLSALDSLRDEAPDLPMKKLLWKIYTETDLLTICSAMPDGRNRCANLMQLLALAQQFEEEGIFGLHAFVCHLDRMKEKNTASPAALGETSAVQIYSIHRSKGLEFPVVFLCDTARKFNLRDSMETVLVHPELGLGPKLVDNRLYVQRPTVARKAIAMRLRREALSEEMRLQYVALTRAKERLFITAAVKEPDAMLSKLRTILPKRETVIDPEALSEAAAPVEWFAAAALADREEHLHLIRGIPVPQEACTDTASAELPEDDAAVSEVLEALRKNLAFSYPYSETEKLPSKITATELKHSEFKPPEEEDAAALIPSETRQHFFRLPDLSGEDRPLTAAERGIATHLALQYMDLHDADTPDGVHREILRLTEQQFLSPRQAEAVREDAILQLFRSEIGRQILTADKLHREFRFSLLCPASDLLAVSSRDEILLQGVVDCCIETPEDLLIIDYKTDHVFTEEQIASRCRLYASQLRAYALALSRIFEKPVRKCVLYFLSCGKAVSA